MYDITFDHEAMREFRSSHDLPANGTTPVLESAELLDEIEVDIRYYGTLGTDYGNFLIGILEALARRVRFTGAKTVSEYLDRRAVLDAEPGE